jgi:cell division protein FtsW
MNEKRRVPKIHTRFLITIYILLGIGLLTFVSATLPVFTENRDFFWSLVFRQAGLGVGIGIGVMFLVSRIPLGFFKKYATYIFIASIILTFLVFVPSLGFSHGGALRWISLGFISFQPAEILKFGVVVFLSAWFAQNHDKFRDWRYGLLPLLIVLGIAVFPLLRQPDSGTMILVVVVGFVLYWINNAPLRHVAVLCAIGMVGAIIFASLNPYIIDRLRTFTDSNADPFGSSYQIRQSKIAIGAGKLTGRGLGQSVHKFGSYLPEANSDSVFAIFAEEYGFIGGLILISLYSVFAFLGLRIAKRAPTDFARNVVTGIVMLIVVQVFFNIAAISGIVPLSGMPLIFMSQGGTALIVTLAELGIILGISRKIKEIPRRRRIVEPSKKV